MNISDIDFEKGGGLVPAIIQDASTYQILMLGYMNEEALKQTLDKEKVTFYSRTKQRLWTKGETSGNTLDLVDIQKDCDNDTLLILASPNGPTCHKGTTSCFSDKDFKPSQNELEFLTELEDLIISRKEELPEGSYTTSLFTEGIDKIVQKVGEEAIETIIEAKNNNRKELVDETADLLYHLMVLLAECDLPLGKVVERLKERHTKRITST